MTERPGGAAGRQLAEQADGRGGRQMGEQVQRLRRHMVKWLSR